MNVDYKIAKLEDSYVNLFNENREKIFSWSPEFINNMRVDALENFKKKGFPNKKTEEYKYTDIQKLFREDIQHVLQPKEIEFDIEDIFTCDIPDLDTRVILVLNGFFFSPEKTINTLDNGIIFGSTSAASREYPELFQKHYGKYADYKKDSLTALNTAFAQDGVFLYVPRNVKMEKPIQIIHLLLAEEKQLVQHRNLFILEENSEANVVICDHTLSVHQFLTNSVTEIYTGQNASFDMTRVQNEHNNSYQLTNAFTHQERDSRVNTNYISLHGGVIRNNVHVDLNDENCDNNSLGLFLADQNQHIDNFTYINHLKPHCTSNQLYKGILDDEATGAFNGKIHVWQDAQQTLAYQKNNNILLTDTAKMHSKPQLEIYADDVKCSHGATVGQLDQEAIFYLRSRGIPEKESRHLMMYAFAYDVISHIKVPALKERIIELVDKRLRGELSRCNNCKMKCR